MRMLISSGSFGCEPKVRNRVMGISRHGCDRRATIVIVKIHGAAESKILHVRRAPIVIRVGVAANASRDSGGIIVVGCVS